MDELFEDGEEKNEKEIEQLMDLMLEKEMDQNLDDDEEEDENEVTTCSNPPNFSKLSTNQEFEELMTQIPSFSSFQLQVSYLMIIILNILPNQKIRKERCYIYLVVGFMK